mgnify:CR=1 FL=1
MFQKLKDQFESLTPKQKKMTIIGGPAVVLIMGFVLFGSDEELLKIPERNESEIGLFGVDDSEVSVGDLSTKLSALVTQVEMLSQRDNTTAASVKRMEDIVQSLSASDTNVQTMYELTRKLKELEEKLADVQVDAQTPRAQRATITYVEELEDAEDKSDDPAPGEVQTLNEEPEPIRVAERESRSFSPDKETFDYDTQRKDIPADPMQFLQESAKRNKVSIESSGNMFIDDDQRPISAPSTTSATDEVAKAEAEKSEGPEYEGKRVLAGSVVPFVLINGFKAPAGEAASENPVSATVRLTGPAILPNGYSVDLTGCLVTNLVRGDAATELAYLRPDRLTCKYDYGAVDISIQGFASGHDGSAGIRGRLVNNKRDKILLYGTLTGGLSGLGQAFGGNGASRSVSISGAYELPETNEVLIGAGTSSVSNAADFLTEYYQAKLQEYYDVIEIQPLVTGTLHVMTSFKMRLLNENDDKVGLK